MQASLPAQDTKDGGTTKGTEELLIRTLTSVCVCECVCECVCVCVLKMSRSTCAPCTAMKNLLSIWHGRVVAQTRTLTKCTMTKCKGALTERAGVSNIYNLYYQRTTSVFPVIIGHPLRAAIPLDVHPLLVKDVPLIVVTSQAISKLPL